MKWIWLFLILISFNFSHALPDIQIDSNSISLPENIKQGQQFNVSAKVFNIGNENAINVETRVFVDDAQIFFTVLDVEKDNNVNLQFSYLPFSFGYSTLKILLNESHDLNEENYSNNSTEVSFYIEKDSNEMKALTLLLTTKENCLVVLDNGLKVISKAIEEHDNEFFLNYKIVDLAGNLLMSGLLGENDENVMENFTLRGIQMSEHIAKFLVIAPVRVNILYNSCDVDFENALKDLDYKQMQLENCQETVGKLKGERDACQTNLNGKDTALTACQSDKSTISTQLSLSNNACDERISSLTQQKTIECNEKINLKTSIISSQAGQLNELKETAQIGWWFGFSIIIFGAGIFIYNYYRQQSDI